MPCSSLLGHGRIVVFHERRRIIFEPGQADRAVKPDSAQKSNLTHGCRDVRREPRSRGQHQQHVAGRRLEHRTTRKPPRPHRRRRKSPNPMSARARFSTRAAATGRYQRSHASRRCAARRGPMRITRTSLPGAAVVARSNRWRASRFAAAPRSSATRSTPGRHVEVNTVGSANTTSSASAGWIDTSNASVTPSRKIQPQVLKRVTYTCGRAQTPGCAARPGDRDTRGVRGARSWPSRPAASPRATRARS